MHPIILASSSIYRQELLSRLKIPFTTFSSDIDETPRNGESIFDMVLRLSKEKALAAAIKNPGCVCIGSDEVASLNNTILGKPGNYENAVKQLSQMSGKEVIFYTGVCVSAPFLRHEECRMATTTVTFRKLPQHQIENYLRKEEPYQSAGSFKSETLGSALLEKFESEDPTAIIGLPLIMLCEMLRKVGIEVI
jgi:septum formation protein